MISPEVHGPERAPSARADERSSADHGHRQRAMIEHGLSRTCVRSDVCSIEPVPERRVKSSRTRMRGDVLTDRQQEVLDRIREHVQEWGMPPSRSELARTLGLAFGSAGQLQPEGTREKGLDPADARQEPRDPAVTRGRARVRPCGPTLGSGRNAHPRRREPSEFPGARGPGRAGSTRGRTSTWSSAGTAWNSSDTGSGDILAVQRQPNPRSGDVVIARIGSEITLKCFQRVRDTRVELQPRSAKSGAPADRDR